jgi:sulfite reductase alpha subunit-like flavoprotein
VNHLDFEPGDAIGVISPNSTAEVEALLDRLKVKEVADKVFTLSVKPGTKGKLPPHLPTKTTLRNAFLYYIDIRTSPKKVRPLSLSSIYVVANSIEVLFVSRLFYDSWLKIQRKNKK